jgi:anti-sigma B factor antagonist
LGQVKFQAVALNAEKTNQSATALFVLPTLGGYVHVDRGSRKERRIMKVSTTDVNGVTVVEIEGVIMLGDGSAFELRDTVRELLARGRKNILLNLASVGYIDSAAVGQLIDAYKRVHDTGGDVKLLKLGARVDNMLQITKLYRVFDAYDDERTALARFVTNDAGTFPIASRSTFPEDDGAAGGALVPG